jgi:hypothetical protein
MEFPSRVELDSQGFAVLRVTVSLREHWLGIKGSNLGHPESESGVLPTELIPNGDFDGSRSRDLWRDRPALSQLSYEAKILVLVTAIQHLPFRGVGSTGLDGCYLDLGG